MKGQTKTPKVPGFMRHILAVNVARLMEVHYAAYSNRPKQLAKDAHVSLSTVQRIVAGSTGANLDGIEAIANAFDLSAYQLLIPNLDPANAQVVHGATKEEERLYRRWKRTGAVGVDTGKFPSLTNPAS